MGFLPKIAPNMENQGNTIVAKESDKNKQNVWPLNCVAKLSSQINCEMKDQSQFYKAKKKKKKTKTSIYKKSI
jgi:hypothetical protein